MAKKDYPYSSIFDYDQIAQEEEQKKQRLQASQQRIMRTNVIGDALRLLSDAAGGSRGATITARPVNPGILKASGRFNALEDQSQTNMERFRLQDLAMREKDMSYGLGLEAEGRQTERRSNELEQEQIFRADESEKNRIQQDKMQEAGAKLATELEKLRNFGDINLENTRSRNDLKEIGEKYEGELSKITTKAKSDVKKAGGFYTSRYDDPTQLETLSREAVISQFDKIRAYLKANKVYPESYNYPKVLEQQNKGNISDDDLDKIVQQFPDVFGKLFSQLLGPNIKQPQQPAYNSPYRPGGMFQLPLKGYGGQSPIVAPTDTEQKPINIILPDKKGNTDLSLLFN